MEENSLETAKRLAQRVAEAGGRVYYVGGFVRDWLRSVPVEDVDVEVHGIAPETLRTILDALGERTEMGKTFGIYGLRHVHLDIAMPRTERALGKGHRDFDVQVDPWIGPERACLRRDFTINAMMMDVLTGEILDFYGGRADLSADVLRHVSDASFGEDPLRALRGAQFAARFHFRLAPETVRLCAGMALTALPRERVYGEMEKALLRSDRPSLFFDALREMRQLSPWFKEAHALIGVAQEPAFHPEGDVWNHTLRVLDAAASLRANAAYPMALMLAALAHDFGKPQTSAVGSDGRIHSYGHEQAGVPLAEVFVSRLTGEERLRKTVGNLVGLHMQPGALLGQRSGVKAYMRLFDKAMDPEDLILLAMADRMGTGSLAGCGMEEDEALLRERLALYHERASAPGVTGQDLIAAGYAPGPAFAKALAYAHRLKLSGVPRKEALSQTLHWLDEQGKECE